MLDALKNQFSIALTHKIAKSWVLTSVVSLDDKILKDSFRLEGYHVSCPRLIFGCVVHQNNTYTIFMTDGIIWDTIIVRDNFSKKEMVYRLNRHVHSKFYHWMDK